MDGGRKRSAGLWLAAACISWAAGCGGDPPRDGGMTPSGDAAGTPDTASPPDSEPFEIGVPPDAGDALPREDAAPLEDAAPGEDAAPVEDADVSDTGPIGCTPGSCALGQVCQFDGTCGAPCPDNADCENRYGLDTYCNRPGQPPPRYYKTYRDNASCAPLGCERPADCMIPGTTCDTTQAPPACVAGCFNNNECLFGQVCKGTGGAPPLPSYTTAQCRALPSLPPGQLGVCCDPGCTNRVLECGINQWCCAETGSPFEDPLSCGPVSFGGVQAQPGECFDIAAPFCVACDPADLNPQCDSMWTAGFNVDPNINGGAPFQEQEFCVPVSATHASCAVTCNPSASDQGCPRGWACSPRYASCFVDADCNGLSCEGENVAMNIPGRCQCGMNGVPFAACPASYPLLGNVDNPRCVEAATGDMFCIATYNCMPPADNGMNYPAGCFQ